MSPKRILVEGWRQTPHSIAVVSQFQCLEFLKRPDVALFHRELPLLAEQWKRIPGLFAPADEQALAAIPAPPEGADYDATIRMQGALDGPAAGRVFAFRVTEFGMGRDLEAHARSAATLVTPSEWSRRGLLRMGADEARVRVIPHGADPEIYRPLPEPQRAELRRQFGWEGFVFLNIGALTPNKGVRHLVQAFAAVCERFPEARLYVKGLDALYKSTDYMGQTIQRELSPAQIKLVQPRTGFTAGTLTFTDMARLYQAADAYVAPYYGEGFNLPVLEALSCGLPVLCTDGGSTDDFTRPEFALKIESRPATLNTADGLTGQALIPQAPSLIAQMTRMLRDADFVRSARRRAPEYVRAHFTWKHVVDQWLALM